MQNIKKYFMTLALLLMAVTGAWADYTVTWEGTTLQGIAVRSNTATTSQTVEGITVTASNGDFFYNTTYPKGPVVIASSSANNGLVFSAENNIKSIAITFTESAYYGGEIAFEAGAYTYQVSPAAKSFALPKNDLFIGITKVVFTLEGDAPVAGPEVSGPTIVEGKPQWTFAMPAYDVELQVEYYPGMLVKPTNLVGGTMEIKGLGLGTTSFTAPSDWSQNSTKLTSGHFEGFKSVTEEEAKAWPGVPATGMVALFYNYDETEQKWDMIYFKDGAFYDIYKGEPQQLATIYNLIDANFSVFYTTGMQMPEGFEKDDAGNIYVKKDTKFTVKATPAEGYHLVGWSDKEGVTVLEREFTMTDDDFTVTAQFSNEYDIAFQAANANTIETGKATVKVGETAAEVKEGKLTGVKMDSKVTITAKDGYKFRKAEATKTVNMLYIEASNHKLYYMEGETWRQAINNHTDLNQGWQYGGMEVWFGNIVNVLKGNGAAVDPGSVIDPTKTYTL